MKLKKARKSVRGKVSQASSPTNFIDKNLPGPGRPKNRSIIEKTGTIYNWLEIRFYLRYKK